MGNRYFEAMIMERLHRIERMVRLIAYGEVIMSKELDDLIAQVKANTDAEDAAEVAIQGLADQIKALAASGGTPAQFTALADSLRASATKLGDAIVANTPVASPA